MLAEMRLELKLKCLFVGPELFPPKEEITIINMSIV